MCMNFLIRYKIYHYKFSFSILSDKGGVLFKNLGLALGEGENRPADNDNERFN